MVTAVSIDIANTDTTHAATATPPSRGHKKRARTRAQLLDAAVRVIAERGDAFTVNDVALEAGVSNGTFYDYFDDRDALLATIIPELLTTFDRRGSKLVDFEDPLDRLATISALGLRSAIHSPEIVRTILRLDAAQAAVLSGEPFTGLRIDIAAAFAVDRITVAPTQAVVDSVVGTMFMALRRTVADDLGEDYHRQVLEQILRSLGADGRRVPSVAARAVELAASVDEL